MFEMFKKLNESFSKNLKENYNTTEEEIENILEKNGYCIDCEGASDYIESTADYIEMSNQLGADISVEEWFNRTVEESPEDLEFMMKDEIKESTEISAGPVSFKSDLVTNTIDTLGNTVSNSVDSIANNADEVGGAVAAVAPLLMADDASEKKQKKIKVDLENDPGFLDDLDTSYKNARKSGMEGQELKDQLIKSFLENERYKGYYTVNSIKSVVSNYLKDRLNEKLKENNDRFVPKKRTALDGKTYWCVYDTSKNNWSSYTCHGKYKTREDCQYDIDHTIDKYGNLMKSNKRDTEVDKSKNESLSDDIRKDNLGYCDETDSWYAEEGNTKIQIQDRQTNTQEFATSKNKWGQPYIDRKLNRQPKTSSNSWGRVWKNGKLVKQFEGPKYQVRQDMARYLDKDDIKESLRKIFRKLNEAEISPEDKRDSDLIRSIYRKIGGKKLNPKDLTAEEQEVLDRYGIDVWGYKGDSKVVTDKGRKDIINRREAETSSYWNRNTKENPQFNKINYADRARKIDDRDYAQRIRDRNWDNKKSFQDAERAELNRNIVRPVSKMEQALANRRYAQNKLSTLDADLDKDIRDAEQKYQDTIDRAKRQRDSQVSYYSGELKRTNQKIQDLLDKHRIKECIERLNEAEMSDEDRRDNELLRSIYNKLQYRKNAALTPEEKEVVDKYGLKKDSFDRTDGSYWIGRRPKENSQLVNYADRIRKIPQRRYAREVNRNSYNQSFQDAERKLQNSNLKRDVYDMTALLDTRNYHKSGLDKAQRDYDTASVNAENELIKKSSDAHARRDYNETSFKKQVKDSQEEIDNLLKRNRNESLYRRSKRIMLREDVNESRRIETNIDPEVANIILDSVLGQMSDGIWENTPGMYKYWLPVEAEGTELVIKTGNPSWGGKYYDNPYNTMSDTEIKKYFANKLKTIVREYLNDNNLNPYKGFNEDNEEECTYLSRGGNEITVGDAYKAYKALLM